MSSSVSLEDGIKALRQGQYQEAIDHLNQFCQTYEPNTREFWQAHMHLIRAYHGNGQLEQAIEVCQRLTHSSNAQVQIWAQQTLTKLQATASPSDRPSASATNGSTPPLGPARRAATAGVKLMMTGIAGNLALASTVTLLLLLGMVFALVSGTVFITDSQNPGLGFAIALGLTLLINAVVFWLSPYLMDLTQHWLYGTRWISLAEVAQLSPESARLIQQICSERRLKQPRLGLIEDQNPTAFTYGSLPNTARLVVSRGLFTYLDDDEIATVYAHELGHVVHWDFAVMTLASTLVQITYLIYIFARRLGRGGGDSKVKDAAQTAALVAYVFYWLGTYLVLYLSRTREYFADHFAAESTGNPNGLARALVKIAYGIVEEGKRSTEPSRLVEGTRALGIYDAKAATSTGTAYRMAASPEKVGRVFLWDLFNPWGWWMELNSTHPLTGKRIRALATYAEQLGLNTEFDMANVVAEGRLLNKGKLYGHFVLDLLLYGAETIGFLGGLVLGIIIAEAFGQEALVLACPLFGLGIGILIKIPLLYPSFTQAPATNMLTLMSDPYASPLRGQPAQLQGELIGRGDAGYTFGSDLKLQDQTGMIFLRYASRFGPIGNFLFGMKRVKNLIGTQGQTSGWFRRGVMPWMDLHQYTSDGGTTIKSYPRFWAIVMGVGAIGLAMLVTSL